MRVHSQFSDTTKPLTLFFSYAHSDEDFRVQLDKHLGVFKREKALHTWHDREIRPGEAWEEEIHEELERADIILLLVSPDFVMSDYCWDIEMKRAMERHATGEATVVPIILRPTTGWQHTPFGALQALPTDGRPVTSWRSRDGALANVAGGLASLLKKQARAPAGFPEQRVIWSLLLEGDLADYSQERCLSIQRTLRRLAQDVSIELIDREEGSAKLILHSTQSGYDRLQARQAKGTLSDGIRATVLGLSTDIGHLLRIYQQDLTHGRGSVTSPPDEWLLLPGKKEDPSLLRILSFPPERPHHLSFMYHPHDENMTAESAQNLTARLGRYFMTCLVVKPDQLNVSLSPFEKTGGLPTPLQRTELGRDLLAQDLDLKRFTASALHPTCDTGRAFWDAVERSGESISEHTLRVWVIPKSASIEEKVEEGTAYVILKDFHPQVLCEEEYHALASQTRVAPPTETACATAFRDTVLRVVQDEVLTSKTFGLLRQALSALALSAWYRNKYGAFMKGFLDTNDTAAHGLDVVTPDATIHERYMRMFREGTWRFVRSTFDFKHGVVAKRLLVVGGIRPPAEHHAIEHSSESGALASPPGITEIDCGGRD